MANFDENAQDVWNEDVLDAVGPGDDPDDDEEETEEDRDEETV